MVLGAVELHALQPDEHEVTPSELVIAHDAPAQQYPGAVCTLPLAHTGSVSAHAGKPSVGDGSSATQSSCSDRKARQ